MKKNAIHALLKAPSFSIFVQWQAQNNVDDNARTCMQFFVLYERLYRIRKKLKAPRLSLAPIDTICADGSHRECFIEARGE